jgi:hypothetical protein
MHLLLTYVKLEKSLENQKIELIKFSLSSQLLVVILWPSAPVVKLVDAPHSKCGTARCVGSSPTWGTNFKEN